MEYQHGGDIYSNGNIELDYSININPSGMPMGVREAAVQAVHRCACYPDSDCGALREALSEFHKLTSEWIICGNGAADLIFGLALSLKPGKALIVSPTFSEYETALLAAGAEVLHYDLQRASGFQADKEMLASLTEDVDMVFYCNPNNPTGVLTEAGFMKEMLNRCREKNIILVVDECFMDFVKREVQSSLINDAFDYDNLFVLKAFTKTYAMAGIRLGYGICSNSEIINSIRKSMQPWSVSSIAQEAGIAALREKAYVEKTGELIERERPYLIHGLKKLGYQAIPSFANYILFHRPGNVDLYRECLSYGILIRSCHNYRGLGVGDYRITVGLHGNNRRLLKVLEEIEEKAGRKAHG